ncbi:N-6 DNA methylase [Parvibaculum sp.]|uniref:Eco57I restriction-modification methylase domain-containing protein n=1 Tax=Parvibaculum sp. TaxID=2024848 RepID=UPI00320E1F4C
MSHAAERLAAIRDAVSGLAGGDLAVAGRKLLDVMGYRSPKTLDAPAAPAQFLAALGMDASHFETGRWRAVHFLFQLTGDELPALSRGGDPATGESFQRSAIDSFVFLAIDLDDGGWSRRQLVAIVRALNRGFAMPAIVLFRHGARATLTVIDRRASRRDALRDVVGGRISLIKDIELARPHRAHVEILADLSLAALARRKAPSDFRALYDLWLETLSAAELNKRFYEELADWFAWASTSAPLAFPKGQGNGEGAKEIALIRLLTRLMFVWFIKEKDLVPEALFDGPSLAKMLKEPPAATPSGHGYYLAILQNLFFATLNTETPERRWRHDESGQSKDYLGHHVYRHAVQFAEPDKALEAFASVPFLNGGLFECLDTEIASDDPRAGHAERERGRLILRIDGFSDQPDKQPRLPNALFFGGAKGVDLSGWFEKAKAPRDVPGLIDLFERYKFTVEENTPLEEEAALDPELLGKVFENLLASYNEDTKTTARNKSGSFYTPREVVDFMVDEALVAWLLPKLPSELGLEAKGDDEARLRALLSFASRTHDFSPAQVGALIAAIENCKAIDPAVGSGAFPLGLLQKLVHMLDVLDPGGERWKARNRLYYERRLTEAEAIPAANERSAEIKKAVEALAEFDAKFECGHYPDYTRKLFLIDRCLHGVDIQPIAVQIAKLRCFISLAVEQKEKPGRPNRGITPLPNLEAKFVAANTLTPLHRRGQVGLVSQDLLANQRALREANRAFFAAPNGAAKRAVQKKITTLRKEIAGEVARDHAFAGDDARKLAAWDPFDPNAFAPFFDAEWMFGLSPDDVYFDVILGNPPYRQIKKNEYSKLDYPFTEGKEKGKQNLYKIFIERAKQLAGRDGQVCLIVQSSLMADASATETRRMLLDHSRLSIVMEFPKKSADATAQVFESVLQGTCILQFKGTGSTDALRLSHGNNTKTISSPVWTELTASTIKRLFPHSCILPLVGPSDLRVMEAIRAQSVLLEALVDVEQSTKGDLNLGTNANMISDVPTGVMLIRGAHVGRYVLKYDGESWINSKFRPDKRLVNRDNRILVGQNITGTTDPFRLIFCEIASGQEYLVGDSALKVVPIDDEDAEFILACLCSKPLDWYFRRTSTNNHVNVYELLELPIPNANAEEKESVSVAVRCILAGAERPRLEALINAFVYELFFVEELHARSLRPFAAARAAGLMSLARLEGPALARAADDWSRCLADPAHTLYATLFDLQSIDAVRIIEGRV